jgi:hypothetical protein
MEMVSTELSAADVMRQIFRPRAPGDKILPMTIDAESWLRLTLGWLSNRLDVADVKDAEKMMRGYAQLCLQEACPEREAR